MNWRRAPGRKPCGACCCGLCCWWYGLGGLAGWLAWFWVTRPVRQLTALVATDDQDSIHAIKALAAQTPEVNPGNEVTRAA